MSWRLGASVNQNNITIFFFFFLLYGAIFVGFSFLPLVVVLWGVFSWGTVWGGDFLEKLWDNQTLLTGGPGQLSWGSLVFSINWLSPSFTFFVGSWLWPSFFFFGLLSEK